ncbi:hypothetical protein, partial [Mesorhizobium sp. M0060]|uniref:hypothetical protein n=1 Tax=Mesorhizobium sp. M0060 TaxID=2956866 RepID=UPI00333A3C88
MSEAATSGTSQTSSQRSECGHTGVVRRRDAAYQERTTDVDAWRDVDRETPGIVSASPITYGFGLDVFRNRQGMSSSIWLCGWPLMM